MKKLTSEDYILLDQLTYNYKSMQIDSQFIPTNKIFPIIINQFRTESHSSKDLSCLSLKGSVNNVTFLTILYTVHHHHILLSYPTSKSLLSKNYILFKWSSIIKSSDSVKGRDAFRGGSCTGGSCVSFHFHRVFCIRMKSHCASPVMGPF